MTAEEQIATAIAFRLGAEVTVYVGASPAEPSVEWTVRCRLLGDRLINYWECTDGGAHRAHMGQVNSVRGIRRCIEDGLWWAKPMAFLLEGL